MVAQQKNVEVPRIEITWFGLLTLNQEVPQECWNYFCEAGYGSG
jgi:hypothetical protein